MKTTRLSGGCFFTREVKTCIKRNSITTAMSAMVSAALPVKIKDRATHTISKN